MSEPNINAQLNRSLMELVAVYNVLDDPRVAGHWQYGLNCMAYLLEVEYVHLEDQITASLAWLYANQDLLTERQKHIYNLIRGSHHAFLSSTGQVPPPDDEEPPEPDNVPA